MNPQLRRLALDLGPLLIFFAAFKYLGIFGATAAFMVAVLVALALGYAAGKAAFAHAAVHRGAGGDLRRTDALSENDIFIKMKPTVLYGFFGAVLLGGLAFNRLFIKYVFAQAFELDEQGWRKLTWRWGLFLPLPGRDQRNGLASTSTGDLGVIQGLGHHPVDLPVRARTDAAGDKTSDPAIRRQQRATMMRRSTYRMRTIAQQRIVTMIYGARPRPHTIHCGPVARTYRKPRQCVTDRGHGSHWMQLLQR